jgi:hypothetical protein
MSVEPTRANPRVSKRLATGSGAIEKGCDSTAELVALQTGQKWESCAALRSAQKWNCAPKNMTARSKARMRIRRAF